MDAAIPLSVVPVIVGLVVLALRPGLPPLYETQVAVALGVAINPDYVLDDQLAGDTVLADALLRGIAPKGTPTPPLSRRSRSGGPTSGGPTRTKFAPQKCSERRDGRVPSQGERRGHLTDLPSPSSLATLNGLARSLMKITAQCSSERWVS